MDKPQVDIMVTPVHHISLYEAIIPDWNEKIKEDLKEYIYNVDVSKSLMKDVFKDPNDNGIGPHKQRHKVNLIESNPNLFDDTTNDSLNKVKEFCYYTIGNVIMEANKAKDINTSNWIINFTDSWFHITKDGGYHDYHTHLGSAWSGIFYVDIGESNIETANGINRFYNPFPLMPQMLGLNALTANNFEIVPQDGKLVMSPGFLPHCAVPYKGKKDRIVIAFNVIVRDSLDVDEKNEPPLPWRSSKSSYYNENGDTDE